MSQEMAAVRQKVLSKPGVLRELVQQLRQGKLEQKAQAAELLFCVVGQGPSADAAATKQVNFSDFPCMSMYAASSFAVVLHT